MTKTNLLSRNTLKPSVPKVDEAARERLSDALGVITLPQQGRGGAQNQSLDQIVSRFLGRMDIKGKNDCWNWDSRNKVTMFGCGYGHLHVNGRRWLAHRLSHELFNGPIPEGMFVRHTCNNPACCNPRHLLAGTKRDNAIDRERDKRGNHHRGSQVPNSVLSEDIVARIKSTTGSSDWGISVRLSELLGVNKNTIQNVFKGRTWKHVEPNGSPFFVH